jgi:hypothetical protein
MKAIVPPAVIAAAIVATYSNCLENPFLFDGIDLERQLRVLTDVEPAAWIQLRPRAAGYLLFELQNTLHGYWPPGYNAVNIAIHAAAAVALYLLVEATLARADAGQAAAGRSAPSPPALPREWIACAAALFWGLHPLQTHSVAYVYQRFESMMGLFFLLSLVCLERSARGRTGGWWQAASYGCFALALATKEVAITAPAVLLLYDRVFLAGSFPTALRRRWPLYAALFFTLAAGVGFVLANVGHYRQGGILTTKLSVWQYLGTQPEIIGHYLAKAVWPMGLGIDPAWPLQEDPVLLASEWAIAGLTVVGMLALYRRRPELGFLPISSLLILVPTSSIAPIIDLAYEHRFYLSLAPLATALALAIGRGSPPRLVAAARAASDGPPVAVRALAVMILAVALAAATHARNTVHADALSLWQDTVAKAPHNMRALCNLGIAFEDGGDPAAAAACYREAISLYRAARGQGFHPSADAARRTPRTSEYAWCAYARLARLELDSGDRAAAADLFEELAWLPFLPARADFRAWIDALERDLADDGDGP